MVDRRNLDIFKLYKVGDDLMSTTPYLPEVLRSFISGLILCACSNETKHTLSFISFLRNGATVLFNISIFQDVADKPIQRMENNS